MENIRNITRAKTGTQKEARDKNVKDLKLMQEQFPITGEAHDVIEQAIEFVKN